MENLVYKIYQKIGDFFTGKRRVFWILIILMWLGLAASSIYYKIQVPLDTLYWIFSSIVQALLAFAALFGVMVIFKLQSIHANEERLISGLNRGDSALGALGGKLSAITIGELLSNIKKIIGEGDKSAISGDNYKILKGARDEIEIHLQVKIFVKEFMLKFIIYTFCVVILSLILLAISHLLFRYNFGLSAVFLIIILTIYSLFLSIRGTAETLF